MCLSDRFKVEAMWNDGTTTGSGTSMTVGDDLGAFWFFSSDNAELLVQAANGCSFNDHFWVFAAASTDVEYTADRDRHLNG